MRVAYFGLPLGALLLARDGHDIVLAAISRPEAVGMRRLTRRLGEHRVLRKPDARDDALLARTRAERPELLVSWFWTTRLPRALLLAAPHGAIGVHPSLLPRHRGPDPYFWAIYRGDLETGVTAHRLDDRYDTGAILAQRSLRIDPEWNAWTLARKLDRPSLALLREVVRAYAAGAPPTAAPQDEAHATDAPEPDESTLALAWDRAADDVLRLVRAAGPWPGAFTSIGDAVVTVTLARTTHDFPRALVPGEAWVRGDGTAVVRTGDAAIELLLGRDEEERPLDRSSFAALVKAIR